MSKDDEGFLRKLVVDIYTNAAEVEPPQHEAMFPNPNFEVMNARRLATILIRQSVRLRALMTAVCQQADQRDEKALIFANNPWETMLYTVLFRAFQYKLPPFSLQ